MELGGNGGSLAIKYWDDIKIPKFKRSKMKEIADLYFKEIDYSPENIKSNNFKMRDEILTNKSGILDLSYQITKMRERLNKIIEKIYLGKRVNVDFSLIIN